MKNVLSGSYYYLKIAWLGRTRYLVGVMPLVFFVSWGCEEAGEGEGEGVRVIGWDDVVCRWVEGPLLTVGCVLVLQLLCLLYADNDSISVCSAVAVPAVQVVM